MIKEKNDYGLFIFGIRLLKSPDGLIGLNVENMNKKVPLEYVIMLMRAFLKNAEQEYFNNYKRNFTN